LVQKNTIKVWEEESMDFKKLILDDQEIRKILSKEEIENCFNLEDSFKYIDYIWRRVF
jgi:adenylosuccinate lyase